MRRVHRGELETLDVRSLTDGAAYAPTVRLAAGIISMVVAVLSAVESSLNYDGRSKAHHNAKRAYAPPHALRRKHLKRWRKA